MLAFSSGFASNPCEPHASEKHRFHLFQPAQHSTVQNKMALTSSAISEEKLVQSVKKFPVLFYKSFPELKDKIKELQKSVNIYNKYTDAVIQ